MTFQDFLEAYNGRYLDFDGYYGAQCMDLMHQYVVEVLGLTDARILAAPSAKDVYNNFSTVVGNQYFDRIANTPEGVPQEGDIVFWGNGQYGHVAIFIEGNANRFTSFDQNYPTGSPCHVQEHTYGYCLGWLRVKQVSQQAELDQCRLSRDSHWNDLIKMKDALGVSGEYSITTLLARADQLSGLELQISKKDEEIANLKEEATSIQSQLNEALQVNTEAQKSIEKRDEIISALKDTIAMLQDESAKDKAQLKDSAKIIVRLGERIEELKASKPIEAYSPWQLIITGFLRLVRR